MSMRSSQLFSNIMFEVKAAWHMVFSAASLNLELFPDIFSKFTANFFDSLSNFFSLFNVKERLYF